MISARIIWRFPGLSSGSPNARWRRSRYGHARGGARHPSRLGLREPRLIRASFDRPNLFYHVLPKEEPHAQLLSFLGGHEGESGIVYRSTRRKVEETAAFLQKKA